MSGIEQHAGGNGTTNTSGESELPDADNKSAHEKSCCQTASSKQGRTAQEQDPGRPEKHDENHADGGSGSGRDASSDHAGGRTSRAATGGERRRFTSPLLDEWLDKPSVRALWHGWEGLAVMAFGVFLPGALLLLGLGMCAKRLTLVLLNHPVETLFEVGLLLAVPLINYRAWSNFCKGDMRFSFQRGVTIGLAVGASLIAAAVAGFGLFAGYETLQSAIGSSFSTGFSVMALISALSAAAGSYIVNKFRLSRDFPKSRARVVLYAATGAILAVLGFVAAEWRPVQIRLAERMAASAHAQEHRTGMEALRRLNPARELKMECADPRAAGLAGLFIPLKSTIQHRLYFALTGRPLSEGQGQDLAVMPDDYVSKHAVGQKIEGFSLLRSTLNASVHPDTLSSTVNWTFVFKNETHEAQEARAEISIPDGAVITGLTLWIDGEPQHASFAASGNLQGDFNWHSAGHDCPAIVTALGRGRYLLHCYPVLADEELKIRLTTVVPLKSETMTSAFMTLPRLLATNFSLSGEHQLRAMSPQAMSSKHKGLAPGSTAGGDSTLSGALSEEAIGASGLTIKVARPLKAEPVAVLDPHATQLAKEAAERKARAEAARQQEEEERKRRQFVVMIDASRDIKAQVDDLERSMRKKKGAQSGEKVNMILVKPRYVVQNLERTVVERPKHLVVVIDGSVTIGKYRKEIADALAAIAPVVPTSLIIASEQHEKGTRPMSLKEGLAALEQIQFVGGQDNLQSVVKAAELAGETRGGMVLWVHGPQPLYNREIYIMSPYLAQPGFYEFAIDGGEVDALEFFKNHSEIGPLAHVPRSGSVVADLSDFLAQWQSDSVNLVASYKPVVGRPNCRIASAEQARELLALSANERCARLIAHRQPARAAQLAVASGIVTPVSSALILPGGEPQQLQEVDQSRKFEYQSLEEKAAALGSAGESADADSAAMPAPPMQAATNGTIGPDRAVVMGINTSGTVRVNNLANLEALLNIIANLAEIGLSLFGVILMCSATRAGQLAWTAFGTSVRLSRPQRIALGLLLIFVGLAVPGVINWFVASARDANLFD